MPIKVKPKGEFDSMPHWRCGYCFKTLVLLKHDHKPDICRWCGRFVDWEGVRKDDEKH